MPAGVLFEPFRQARFRSCPLYDAPEWYDFDYEAYVGERIFYERAADSFVARDEAYVELGAGTGRLTLPIARRGHRVHAVEPAAAMRERLAARVQAVPGLASRHTLEGATAGEFRGPLDVPLGLVAFPFNGILHLATRGELLAAFRRVHRRLRTHGGQTARLALDMTAPSWEVMSQQKLPWGRVDERPHPKTGHRIFSCDRAEFCPRTRVLTTHTRFLPEGAVEGVEVVLRQTMWTYQEIQHALQVAGFRLESRFGDVDFSPLRERAPRMLIVARPCEP